MAAKKPELTVKQAKFVKAIAQGKSKRQAAMEAYNVKKIETASVMASETLKKPSVREALDMVLAKQGITLELAVAPVAKALVATKVQITGKDEEAFAEVVEDIELQLKGHDRAMKLMGINANEGGTTNYNFINVAKDDKDQYQL